MLIKKNIISLRETLIAVFLLVFICKTYSQKVVTEKMLDDVSFALSDSVKLKLYNTYFKELSGNNENLIFKFKKEALKPKSSTKVSKKNHIGILSLIAIAHRNNKEYDSCEKYQLIALELSKKIDDKAGVSLAYNRLGILEKCRSNYVKALQYYYLAINPLDKERDRSRLATIYMNIGIVYRNLKNPKRAIDYYNTCDSVYKLLKDTDGIIKNNVNRCVALKEYGAFAKAKEVGVYTERLVEKTEIKDRRNLFNLYDIIGNIFLAEKNYSKAELYYLKHLHHEGAFENKQAIVLLYQDLAALYNEWGKKALASKYYNLAIQNFPKNNDPRNQIELLSLKIEFQKSTGNYSEALELSQRKNQLNDSVFSHDLTEKISQMENNISNQKRAKDVELLQKNEAIKDLKIKRQQFFNYGLLVFILLIIVFVFFTLKSLKTNQRINNELKTKNKTVEEQSHIIEEKNKDIIDSINYAQHLQQILLPAETEFKQALPASFLFFEPKDIVSGDFYFIEKTNDFILVAVVDCTGHGVPGAIMSMVANNLLNKIVKDKKLTLPGEILQELNKELYFSLKQNVSAKTANDGLDISICVFYPATMQLNVGAANNSVYVFRNEELIELKSDKMGLGKTAYETNHAFTQKTILLQNNDMIYMFSDGYADQFGGDKGKKMMKKNMKKLFSEIAHLSPKEQYNLVKTNFNHWKGALGQVDDVTVIGFRVTT